MNKITFYLNLLLKSKKKYMEAVNNGNSNEMQLWHGTKEDHIDSISCHSFDWRRSKERCLYGVGSYFSKYAWYSNDYTSTTNSGVRCMFLADVLCGEYTQVNISFFSYLSYIF